MLISYNQPNSGCLPPLPATAKTVTLYRNGQPTAPPTSFSHEPTGGTQSSLPYINSSTSYMGHWAFFDKALSADDVHSHAKAAGFA